MGGLIEEIIMNSYIIYKLTINSNHNQLAPYKVKLRMNGKNSSVTIFFILYFPKFILKYTRNWLSSPKLWPYY